MEREVKCAYHPEVDATGACTECGRLICAECQSVINGRLYCNLCATKLKSSRGKGLGLIKKARTGTGCFVQAIGGILWVGAGLMVLIWTLYVLFSTFGIWTIFVGLLFAPITYLASILIVWFTTGIFPIIMLIPYVVSWVGMVIIGLSGAISGEDY